MPDLNGKTIAIIVTNYGVEEAELADPRQAVLDAGGQVVIVAASDAPVESLVGDKKPGRTFTPDTTIDEADPSGFDGLIIPGGTINADHLRTNAAAITLIEHHVDQGKPVAAICHGPWALVESGRLSGKTLTSYPSLQTDIRNAGATWVDESVSVDADGGWTLVTSRRPGDLDDFNRELVAAFGTSS